MFFISSQTESFAETSFYLSWTKFVDPIGEKKSDIWANTELSRLIVKQKIKI